MGGVIPRVDARLIGDNLAAAAANCDFTSGSLISLPQVKLLMDFTTVVGPVEKAYRFLPDSVGDTVWLPLPSRYSSVVRSPLANDDQHRVYWTNPGDVTPHFNTRARIKAGQPAYDLGTVQPLTAPVITTVTGGDTTVPAIDRVYLYTLVNSFGEESSPSPVSNLMSGPPDATWTITGFPTNAPTVTGRAYPPITSLRLYRTITSQSSGAQFYFVVELPFPTSGTYVDTINDSLAALNDVLETVGWENPPDNLDGLVALTGGMLAGFTNNTVHMTEPNHPHTWPSIYDQSVHYDIVGMVAWQQYLMVLTNGYPSAGSGNTPSNFLLVQTQVAEPCIARGSIVVDPGGVFYASQNGLMLYTGYQITNQTLMLIEKNEWLKYYHAKSIIAARHRQQYIAINETDQGFLIDYREQRLGIEDLTTLKDAVSIWNDEEEGDTLVCADKIIYEWDNPYTDPQVYRWRSKNFNTPLPISLGAVQIDIDPEILDPAPPPTTLIPLDNGDVTLPDGVNAVFNYFAGPKLALIMTRNLTMQQEIFRLPKGFKCFDHQVEIIARVPVSSIQLATTLSELKGV
jgi:hypothetical protein